MKKTLLEITIHTDSETGIYAIGELDFALPMTTVKWLEKSDNRERLAGWLRWLADTCEKKQTPFHERNY